MSENLVKRLMVLKYPNVDIICDCALLENDRINLALENVMIVSWMRETGVKLVPFNAAKDLRLIILESNLAAMSEPSEKLAKLHNQKTEEFKKNPIELKSEEEFQVEMEDKRKAMEDKRREASKKTTNKK